MISVADIPNFDLDEFMLGFKSGYDDGADGKYDNPYTADSAPSKYYGYEAGFDFHRRLSEERTERSIQKYYDDRRQRSGGGVTWVGD